MPLLLLLYALLRKTFHIILVLSSIMSIISKAIETHVIEFNLWLLLFSATNFSFFYILASDRSLVLCYLCVFFLSVTLGGFGADRFYLGSWREGIGKLFSFGGLGVWTLVDVILIASGYVGPADGSLYIF